MIEGFWSVDIFALGDVMWLIFGIKFWKGLLLDVLPWMGAVKVLRCSIRVWILVSWLAGTSISVTSFYFTGPFTVSLNGFSKIQQH